MNCRICQNNTKFLFASLLLNKHSVRYYRCTECSFLQTESPYWLDEAYQHRISILDTGIIQRNSNAAMIASVILFFLFNQNGRFLDYAGGYGLFTRMMRDIGFDFYWHDVHSQNLFAIGFESEKCDKPFELVTSFESFEHFIYPLAEIEKILQYSRNILFSTYLVPQPIPKPHEWCYYSLGDGQHIAFYNKKTLQFMAKYFNLYFCSNGRNIHLFSEKPINNRIFNILAVLSKLGFYLFVKKSMVSRINTDRELLLEVVEADRRVQ